MSIRGKGITVYLLIAFGTAWAIWAVWATPIQHWLVSSDLLVRLALEPLAAIPAGFAPAVAAIVVRKWVTREGFADAGLRLNPRGDKQHRIDALDALVRRKRTLDPVELYGCAGSGAPGRPLRLDHPYGTAGARPRSVGQRLI